MIKMMKSDRLQHFFIVLAVDLLVFFGCTQVFYTSIYIKELDFYMSQTMFVTLMGAIFLIYTTVSTIFLDCSDKESYIADCVIPLGVICILVLAQYWFIFSVLVSIVAFMSILFYIVRNRKNNASVIRTYVSYLFTIIVLCSMICTLYCSKEIRIDNTGTNLNAVENETPKILTNEEWKGLSIRDKLEHLQRVVNYECEKMGCNSVPITADSLPERQDLYNAAVYKKELKEIVISFRTLNYEMYEAVLHSIIHETRHHYQQEVIKSLDENFLENTSLEYFNKVKEWQKEFEGYTNLVQGETVYFEQVVEKDANEYADEELKILLKED